MLRQSFSVANVKASPKRKVKNKLVQIAAEEPVGFEVVVVELILCQFQPLGIDNRALHRVETRRSGCRRGGRAQRKAIAPGGKAADVKQRVERFLLDGERFVFERIRARMFAAGSKVTVCVQPFGVTERFETGGHARQCAARID